MINFIISVSDFDDALTLKKWDIVGTYLEWANKAVQDGGKVIFEQRYENAPPDTIMIISTENDLKNWSTKVSEVIRIIEGMNRNG